MNCMKCGKETNGKQVFCPDCLEEMERYPVKPGTVVQIPDRPEQDPARRQNRRKREIPPEEQIAGLRKLARRLFLALVAAILMICLLIGACWFLVNHQDTPPDKVSGTSGQTNDT